MSWRCAVVSSDASMTAAIADTLRTDRSLEVGCYAQPAGLPVGLNGIVLVAQEASPQLACEQIRLLRSEHPSVALFVATPHVGAEHLDALFDAGICDFVSLPVAEQELLARVHRSQSTRLPAPPSDPAPCDRLRCFIGSSPNFARQIAKLKVFAACDAGVLIIGETGTGKEICAQAMHYLSARADRPWVAVNCGAIPTELIEDELFGHVKGAYTTAHASRSGLVSEAEGGTLFLDDIDCLPLAAQAKLLRFLQEREYRAVGSNKVQRADVRVIAASNLQLSQLAMRGLFRQDLYFRLNVLSLHLPPLRERTEDIRPLALHFIERFATQCKRPLRGLSQIALQRLINHTWPGNVRELQHVIERAVLLAQNSLLTAADIELGDHSRSALSPNSFQAAKAQVVQQFERGFIEQLLAEHAGNVTHAALAAQKNRRAFFALMRKHNIQPQRFRPSPA